MITSLILEVTNSLSIFEFQGLFIWNNQIVGSFEYEIPIYRNLSSS